MYLRIFMYYSGKLNNVLPSKLYFIHKIVSSTSYELLSKIVDIKFSAHDAFLVKPLSSTLKIERLQS